MLKNWILLMFAVLLISLSCERDDICAASTPTTPALTIGFLSNENINENKPINITVYKPDYSDSLVFSNASSIQVPLRTDTTATVLVFTKNPNNLVATEDPDNSDTLTFIYTTQEEFISSACGYRVIFTNLSILNNPGSDGRWIDDINFTTRTISDEDTTQVSISH